MNKAKFINVTRKYAVALPSLNILGVLEDKVLDTNVNINKGNKKSW